MGPEGVAIEYVIYPFDRVVTTSTTTTTTMLRVGIAMNNNHNSQYK